MSLKGNTKNSLTLLSTKENVGMIYARLFLLSFGEDLLASLIGFLTFVWYGRIHSKLRRLRCPQTPYIKFLCRPDLLAASQIVLKLALKLLFLLKQQSLPWSTDWSSTQEPSTQKQQVCQVDDARLAKNPNCLVHLTLVFQRNADFGVRH